MRKSTTINTRIEPKLKHQAESIFHCLGLSSADAIRIFYAQVCLNKGLPFPITLPNDDTTESIDQLESNKGLVYQTMTEVWNDIDSA